MNSKRKKLWILIIKKLTLKDLIVVRVIKKDAKHKVTSFHFSKKTRIFAPKKEKKQKQNKIEQS